MGLYSDALLAAADTQDVQAGGTGILSELQNALTAGAAGAVISGFGSIYNTFASGANALGADVDKIDTYKKLQELDTDWANYYKTNQNAIDVVGFIGSSLVPGTIAVKGLNAVRAGNASNAFGRALGFARTKQAEALDAAIAELAAEGGTVFTRINQSKLAAMGWGFADQTLTAAAFETGVALTMKDSPLLADDSWWDIAKSAILGAAVGGVIGGGIDSVILNRGFKDAVKAVNNRERIYDYQQVLEKFNLDAGDKAYGVIDSLLRLPKEVEKQDALLTLKFRLAGEVVSKEVDLTKILTGSLRGAEKTAMLDFETAVRRLAETDDQAAAGMASFIVKQFEQLKTAGASPSVIRERMGDYLFDLKSIKPATEAAVTPSTDLWYFNKSITAKQLESIKTVEDWKNAFTSSAPFETNAYKRPYIFTGTAEQQREAFSKAAFIGREGDNGFASLERAWEAGRHVAFLPDGTVRVNDSSALWKRVDDPVYNSNRFLNLNTGSLTEDAVFTAADRFPAGKNIADNIKADGVYLAVKEGNKQQAKFVNMTKFKPTGDVEYYTARHAWAAKLEDRQLPNVIDVNDFSLMDRLRTASFETLARIKIRSGEEILGAADAISLPAAIKSAKMNYAQNTFMDAYAANVSIDIRDLAYKLNVEPIWLENTVANRFRDSLAGEFISSGGKTVENVDGIFRKLENYLTRENVIAEYNRPQQFRDLNAVNADMTWRDKRTLIMDTVANNGGQFVTGELAWHYKVQAAIAASKNAASAVLGTERASMLLDLAQDAAKLADSTGVGASFLASSNANYGEILKQWSQNTGKNVHLWIQQDTTAVIDAFSTVATRLRTDAVAAAELGVVTNILRSSGEKYIWNPANNKQLMLRDLRGKVGTQLQEMVDASVSAGKRPFIDIESDIAAEFLRTHSGINANRISKRTTLINSRGMTSNYDPETVYAPPIDTTYFKHFAFVRPIDGKAFGTSEVSMVFGRDAAELSKRISAVDRTNFDVITKDQTEKFFKAKNSYDFDQTINEPRINSELNRSGALNNMFVEVRGENLIEDYIRWHQNQTAKLVRDSVETYYGQQVAELRKLGETYTEMATSKFAGTLRTSRSEVVNPYDDYVKTALDISKRSEYTFFHQANEFVDALGVRAYQAMQSVFGDAKKGIVTWEQANNIMEKYGIHGVYSNASDFFTANVPRDRNLIKEFVSKANMLLANFTLRFDFANSILNIVSTPLMLGTEMASIKNLIKNDPDLVGKLAQLTSVKVPGEAMSVPSTNKLVFDAVRNFFGPSKDELLTRYRANGDIKEVLSQYHSMLDDLAMRADFKVFKDGTERAFEKVANVTGNNFAEQFTRFVSADVMRQLTEPLLAAGKLSLKEQNAYISTFVNRVQGNYISSQRPIVFQGVLGSAVGLFQTYSFNLLQQLLRHVENRDKRAIATMFGMQSGLFGLNGTPLFEAINTHIIGNAAINDGHYDAYSIAPGILGKEVGDWLLYGTASAFPAFGDKWPSLYTRGDINPRHVSILPINPADIPAIDASIRVAKNLADMGKKLVGGADVSTTLLQGLEHNGVNRPLAGFAQVVSGQATTSKGGLISSSSDLSLIASASRIAGSRPMDESIALNALYRNKAYQAADRDRMEFLGERVKTYLYKGEFPPDEVMDGFMKDYAAAGGRVENFNRTMQAWAKDANISTVDKMRSKLQSSYGQRLNEIMGGEPLEDSRHQTAKTAQLLPE